jgi:hypothetical protein
LEYIKNYYKVFDEKLVYFLLQSIKDIYCYFLFPLSEQVEKNKFFLVNLNADPSLNELLVYYLKERTLVGRPDAPIQPDIQLMGLGIQVKLSEGAHPRGQTGCPYSARYSAHGPWHLGKII